MSCFYLGGEDVLANVVDGDSNRNEDQGTYIDIRTALNDSWHEIFDAGIDPMGLPRPTVMESGTAWRGEVIRFFGNMMQLLECRVVRFVMLNSVLLRYTDTERIIIMSQLDHLPIFLFRPLHGLMLDQNIFPGTSAKDFVTTETVHSQTELSLGVMQI